MEEVRLMELRVDEKLDEERIPYDKELEGCKRGAGRRDTEG